MLKLLVGVCFFIAIAKCDPYSCPLFYNPETKLYYDLNPLRVPHGKPNYMVQAGNYSIEFNICAPAFGTFCNPLAAVCQSTKDSEDFNAGNLPLLMNPYGNGTDGCNITYPNGAISRCPAARTSTLQIKCNPSVDIHMLSYIEDPICEYTFVLESKYACGQKDIPQMAYNTEQSDCVLFDQANGLLYDLSPLRLKNDSYFATGLTFEKNLKANYTFNICADLPKPCGYANSASCQEVGEERNSIGAMRPKLELQPGGVSLTYINGDYCYPTGKARVTKINIACNGYTNFAVIGEVMEDPECVYTIHAQSKYACGIVP